MLKAGDVIENPVTGQRVVVVRAPEETQGAYVEIDIFEKPFAGKKTALRHFHPTWTERFEILSGNAHYELDRQERQAGPGDVLDFPAGVAHLHPWNVGADELHFRQTTTPARPDVAGLRAVMAASETLFRLAQAGKVNRDGLPHPLHIAVLLRTVMPNTHLADIPVPVQRALIGLLAAAGRAAGYQASYDAESTIIQDDRILPETRWVARVIVPVLAAAFVILYLWPDNTAQLWAWTIRPRMTPLLMGAGYIGGAYFFFRAARARLWHHVAVGFLPVATFSSFMTLATLLHWDRFNHTHPAFFVWALLYATTPFIVFVVWLRNRRTDPGTPDPNDVRIPDAARWVMGLFGAIILLTGVLLFLFPNAMIGIWPWRLTPLTARVGGGWFALPGVLWLGIAHDPRWSAAPVALQSQAFSIILILIGVARAWGDFDPANPMTWLFVGGMALLLAIIAVVYLTVESLRRSLRASQVPG